MAEAEATQPSRTTSGAGAAPDRDFTRLWMAYGISTLGTWLAFNAFPLIAIRVLHAGPARVAALAAAAAAVGAVLAVPLGPWVDLHRKRPVLIGADVLRCAALLTVPAAHALGLLTFAQLLTVAVVVAASDLTFTAASGAYLKSLVPPEHLLRANARFESTMWTAAVLGPPLGGAAMGALGPVTTVIADAVSYLLSALGLRAIRKPESHPGGPGAPGTPATPTPTSRLSLRDLTEGWRSTLAHPTLRPLSLNTALVNGLIMATEPLLAVLMLGPLHFSPWQYGLAFALPCLGGLLGSRLAVPLVGRYGQRRVLYVSGAVRAVWPLGLVLVSPGVPGLLLVMTVELGLITSCAVFNPVLATHRLEQLPTTHLARALSAWRITNRVSIAACTALWGALAAATTPRTALAAAGVLLLLTVVLLPRRDVAHPKHSA